MDQVRKLTRGEKNKLKAEAYRQRENAIKAYGFWIKREKFAGEYRYYLYFNKECTHPGGVYEDHFYCLEKAEQMIEKLKLFTVNQLVTISKSVIDQIDQTDLKGKKGMIYSINNYFEIIVKIDRRTPLPFSADEIEPYHE